MKLRKFREQIAKIPAKFDDVLDVQIAFRTREGYVICYAISSVEVPVRATPALLLFKGREMDDFTEPKEGS